MNTAARLTTALLLLLAFPACQKKQTATNTPEPSLPAAPADSDLGHGYIRRGDTIHFTGGGTTGTGDNATRIDMPSPDIIKKLISSQYRPFKTAEGLDAASFEALSTTYSRDKNHVYYKIDDVDQFIIVQIPKADPASFQLSNDGIIRDKNFVWRGDRILTGLDPATAVPVEGGKVIKDKDSVHYQETQIPGADPATFRHTGSSYYADSKKVYWCNAPIPDADPDTFVVLGDSFIGKDQNRAYRSGVPLIGFDAASLELILHNEAGYQIYSDKNGFHVNHMTFPRSKPGKAEIIDPRTLKVGNLILLVEQSRNTPFTLFKQDGKLMLESPAYDPTSDVVNGIISAEITPDGFKNTRTSPLPGRSDTPTVPDWQMEVFNYAETAARLIELGKQIE